MVDTLRRLGYPREAEEASRILPDPVDLKQVQELEPDISPAVIGDVNRFPSPGRVATARLRRKRALGGLRVAPTSRSHEPPASIASFRCWARFGVDQMGQEGNPGLKTAGNLASVG